MSVAVIVGIAVGLALDAFSLAAATSLRLRRVSRGQVFRLAFHFGLFQAIMPAVGYFMGRQFDRFVQDWDHWAVFVLLVGLGIKILYDAWHQNPEARAAAADPTRGWSLILLSLATSMDALAVGVTFAFLDVHVWFACVVIGIITAGLTAVGMVFGSRLGARFERRVEVVGGLILIAMGFGIAVRDIFSG